MMRIPDSDSQIGREVELAVTEYRFPTSLMIIPAFRRINGRKLKFSLGAFLLRMPGRRTGA